MIDKKSEYLALPLPNEQNMLEDDCPRIRQAFQKLDAHAKTTDTALAARLEQANAADAALAARLAQATAADEVLATLLLRVAATELAQAVTDGTLVEHGQSLLAQVERIAALERRSWFGTCESPGAQVAKALTLPGFALAPGVSLDIIFSEVNAAEEMTLTINEGEPVPVLHQGVPPEVAQLAKGQIYTLKYSGAAWQIMAGMAPDRVGQTHWFEDTLGRPGFVPYTGAAIADFSVHWPQMAVYLATAHGQARCFESLEEREAAHTEVWHTLASGETISWEGLGGVTKYYYDAENDVLYMPDLRGMMRSMAGDGIVAASMGESAGDRTRNFASTFGMKDRKFSEKNNFNSAGAFYPNDIGYEYVLSRDGSSGYTGCNLGMDPARMVPVGPTNLPRSWGSLACAYLGHPAA